MFSDKKRNDLSPVYIELKNKVNCLKNDIENIELLKDIQDIIIENLLKLEVIKKKAWKKKRNRIKKQIFIVKSFGDAIANIYIDKHNLKQLSYKIETSDIKNSSGGISNKEGFDFEYKVFEEILSKKVPCVLCDITNNLRYGDVCILTGPDPYIIECKKSNNTNKRVRRQIEELKKLGEYYRDDKKKINMGLMEAKRVLRTEEEINYIEKMNRMLDEVKENKISIKKMEKGLYYFIIYGKFKRSYRKLMPIDIKNPYTFFLNQYKNECNWLSYYPFISSIDDVNNLIDFIEGKLFISVIVDLDKIKSIASSLGLRTKLEIETEHPFKFYIMDDKNKKATAMFGISWHYFYRIGLEFVSLKWLMKMSKTLFINNST